jgi:hypothetical protein
VVGKLLEETAIDSPYTYSKWKYFLQTANFVNGWKVVGRNYNRQSHSLTQHGNISCRPPISSVVGKLLEETTIDGHTHLLKAVIFLADRQFSMVGKLLEETATDSPYTYPKR